MMRRQTPLVAHILYRLDIGGLENGLVNLINEIPVDRFHHAIICMTEYTDFRFRIHRKDVAFHALHKRPGKDPSAYVRLWRLLRRIRPDIVHTRNLATFDCLAVAAAAGVPCRVHGEHGRDINDLDGSNWKYNLLRRVLRSTAHRYIPLSRELANWLSQKIGVPEERIHRIYNGVDTVRFHPSPAVREVLPGANFATDTIVIGAIGRMQSVKDQLTLVRAFLHLRQLMPEMKGQLRLALVGDGPLLAQAKALLMAENAMSDAWMPGARNDVPQILRGLDIFVLPSLAEGISNTILEAMASGLPVVATQVGGNAELVTQGLTGVLVPPADPVMMAQALEKYIRDPERMRTHGRNGRVRVEKDFSLKAMVGRYMAVYDSMLALA